MAKISSNESLKQLYILGAGFSKAFSPGIALSKDILSGLKDSDFPDLYRFVKASSEKANGDYVLCNHENIISHILSRRHFFYRDPAVQTDLLRYQLLRFIHKKISISTIKTDADLLAGFLGKLAASKGVALASFNYDNFIEQGLLHYKYLKKKKLGIHYGLPFQRSPFEQVSTSLPKRASEVLEVLKLHGSFNWYKIAQSTDAAIDKVDIADVFALGENDELSEHLFQGEIPVYIPMTHDKSGFLEGNLFPTIWRKFEYYLKQTENIHFIGYGFPRSDYDNLLLFSQYSQKVKSIVVLNEKREKIKRLRNIFPQAKIFEDGAVNWIRAELA